MDDNPTGAGRHSQSARFERPEDRPIGDLVRDLSQQTSTLVRQELELARVELTQKGKTAGIGAGMFGGAGLFGFFAFAALTTAIIAALSLRVRRGLARGAHRRRRATARSPASSRCSARTRSRRRRRRSSARPRASSRTSRR